MPPKKKTGRAAAEAAYANLLKDNTALVGDVGESFDAYTTALNAAIAGRERYDQARAAAVKGGAITNEQLDQMGYTKPAKLPAAPVRAGAAGAGESGPAPQRNGAAPTPAAAPVSTPAAGPRP